MTDQPFDSREATEGSLPFKYDPLGIGFRQAEYYIELAAMRPSPPPVVERNSRCPECGVVTRAYSTKYACDHWHLTMFERIARRITIDMYFELLRGAGCEDPRQPLYRLNDLDAACARLMGEE